MLPASPMWTYNPLTEPMLSGSWVDPLFMLLNVCKQSIKNTDQSMNAFGR